MKMKEHYGQDFLCAIVYLFSCVYSFNIDIKNAVVYEGPKNSYFGYTVALLKNAQGIWVLVGAPRSEDIYQPLVRRPGALYKCHYPPNASSDCFQVNVDSSGNTEQVLKFHGRTIRFHQEKSDQWLGVSLDVEPYTLSSVLVCAHRWTDSFLSRPPRNGITHMNGICYQLNSNLTHQGRKIPALTIVERLVNRQRYAEFSMGGLGMAAMYSEVSNYILMGAPGLNDWSGGLVIERNSEKPSDLSYVEPHRSMHQDSQIGYSLATGHFIYRKSKSIAVGAPHFMKIYLYEIGESRTAAAQFQDNQLGSGFGTCLLAYDLNNDRLDDLLVGSPFYSDGGVNQGRVVLLISRGITGFRRSAVTLTGSKASHAMFGSSMTKLGDLNSDGFIDVAVGAPYEEDNHGAIYIYNGCSSGVWPHYTQRILSTAISNNLLGFGISFSKTMKVHQNKFTEIFVVGSYLSDKAVIFGTVPTIYIIPHIQSEPKMISRSKTCKVNGNRETCVGLNICFSYKSSESHLESVLVKYRLTLDVGYEYSRAAMYSSDVANKSTSFTGQMFLRKGEATCNYFVILIARTHNEEQGIAIRLNFGLVNRNNYIFNAFNGSSVLPLVDNSLIYTIPFENGCGTDGICQSSLSIKTESEIQESYRASFLTKVHVVIENVGETARNVSIIQNISCILTHVRSYYLHSNNTIICQSSKVNMNVLTWCYIGNTEQGRTVNVIYEYWIGKPLPVNRVYIVTTVATSSMQTDEKKLTDELYLNVPQQYVSIQGRSVPEYLRVKINSGNVRVSAFHEYLFHIKDSTDMTETVCLKFPLHGDYITINEYSHDILFGSAHIACFWIDSLNKSFLYTLPKTFTDKEISDQSILRCKVQIHTSDLNFKISVKLSFQSAQLVKASIEKWNTYLSIGWHQNALENHTMAEFVNVTTYIRPVQWQDIDGRLQYWMIVLCVFIGALINLCITFLFYKIGFFKRKDKLELMRKKENYKLVQLVHHHAEVDEDSDSETQVMTPPPDYNDVNHCTSNGCNFKYNRLDSDGYLQPNYQIHDFN